MRNLEQLINSLRLEKDLENAILHLKSRLPEERPLPPTLPRETDLSREAFETRIAILKGQGLSFEYLTGKKRADDPAFFQGSIENFIGTAQLPVGVIGPLRINGMYANGDFYVPLATSEGALVASYNRGAKVISHSGGVRVLFLAEGVSRVPGFTFNDLIDAGRFVFWVVGNFKDLKRQAKTTTRHGCLEDLHVTLDGNHVYLDFEYTTGDAAGQNMVTIATEAVCRFILAECPVKPKNWYIEGNMAGDKKATAQSLLSGRGKSVTAEVSIPRNVCKKILHTDPESIMENWKMSFVGGVYTGSIGVQGHYANALAALFIACGQDVACVSEATVGVTRIDLAEGDDLYASVSLPNLIVGTVGGGTGLPTQRECLEMIGCKGRGTARKFAEICAATALAGEISIAGALSAGEFTQAHVKYGRMNKPEQR